MRDSPFTLLRLRRECEQMSDRELLRRVQRLASPSVSAVIRSVARSRNLI